jgi:hypothetical protein
VGRLSVHRPFREPAPAVRWTIAGLLLWLLVGPRIELPAGLRVEDVVFVALAVLCTLHLRRTSRPTAPTVAVLGVVASGLIAAGAATGRGMVSPVGAVLFAVRPLEYWIAFPAVLLLLQTAKEVWSRRFERLLVIVTVLQTAFAVVQYYFGIPVGFSHAAYTRAAGLTVGPYELGAMSAALLVFWISRGRWALASLATIALAASISRVSILGAALGVVVLVVAWVARVIRAARRQGLRTTIGLHGRSPLLVAGQSLSVVAALLVLAFTVGLIHLPALVPSSTPVAEDPIPAAPSAAPTGTPTATSEPADETPIEPQTPSDSIAKRFASTSVLGSWFAADALAARVPHARNSTEYQYSAYAGLNIYVNVNTMADTGAVEASNLIRFFRWHVILNTFDEPADVVFGLGPSFVGPSVDGSYLRMYADGGLLGLLAWFALIVTWFRRSPLWMTCVTISMLVGATFIDILYAERPMVLFWALLGLAWAMRARTAPAIGEASARPVPLDTSTQPAVEA